MTTEPKEYRFELHLHTAESSPCSELPAAEGIRLYAEDGYDGVVTTDHFFAALNGKKGAVRWNDAVDRFIAGHHAAKEAGAQYGLTVLMGIEIRFPSCANDYLVFGADEALLRQNEWLYELELPEFFEFAQANHLLVIQAHPFRSMCTPADPNCLHGAEIFNGHKGHSSHNELAKAFAEENGLMGTAGSDCHYAHAVGTAAVCFPKLPRSEQELAELLREGNYRLETGRKD